jgi:hypothetical protein
MELACILIIFLGVNIIHALFISLVYVIRLGFFIKMVTF